VHIAPHAGPGNYYSYNDDEWRGMVFAANRADADKLIAELHPRKMSTPNKSEALRKTRNAVWKIADPRDASKALVVKKPDQLRFIKKLTDRYKASKGLRSWNGAVELQRIGVATPRPVAWFERADRVDLTNNWYICEFQPGNLSVRNFFSAFKQGASSHMGVAKAEFLRKLAEYLLKLHRRGAYFRDLSGGNMLVRLDEAGKPEFSLIDTGRARFYPKQLTIGKRLSDLKRAVYKLDWQSRREFMAIYLRALGRSFSAFYRLPFMLYDLKIGLKRKLKNKKK
jgi:tRNA A-37 threonylcarbamoyl transferase component Bud32